MDRHFDERDGEPVAAHVWWRNLLGTHPFYPADGLGPPRRLRGGAQEHQGVPHHHAAARNIGKGGEYLEGALRPAEHAILFPEARRVPHGGREVGSGSLGRIGGHNAHGPARLLQPNRGGKADDPTSHDNCVERPFHVA